MFTNSFLKDRKWKEYSRKKNDTFTMSLGKDSIP